MALFSRCKLRPGIFRVNSSRLQNKQAAVARQALFARPRFLRAPTKGIYTPRHYPSPSCKTVSLFITGTAFSRVRRLTTPVVPLESLAAEKTAGTPLRLAIEFVVWKPSPPRFLFAPALSPIFTKKGTSVS